jgi:hypothetical protein
MDIDWTKELVEQLDWHWRIVRARWASLTDAEYLWEPVPGCWSLRPRGEATTSMAAGAGDVVADFEFPEPKPVPVTTIAWRLAHLSIAVFGERASNHFGDGGVDPQRTNWSLTAAGGLELLDGHYDAWITGVRGLGEAGLARPCGPAEGPYADYPFATLVLHITREAIHHAAEISLLLDLHAARFQGGS